MAQESEPTVIDQLPDELTDLFPEIAESLTKGFIEYVPKKVLEQLPAGVVDQIPEQFVADPVNMSFVLIGIAIACVSLIMFGWSLAKAFARIATFFIIAAAVAGAFIYVQF